LEIRNLGKFVPSSLRFSPNGDLLVIGFVSGALQFYNSKLKKTKGSSNLDLSGFVLEMSIKEREPRTPVVNIEFS
jgi:hypothetical protein